MPPRTWIELIFSSTYISLDFDVVFILFLYFSRYAVL